MRQKEEYVNICMENLYKELYKYSSILIYGTGHYANIVYELLKKVGLKNKIISFIVTSLNEVKAIEGISVKAVDELILYNAQEYVVLVSVSRLYEEEILQKLKDYSLIHVVKLTDYIIQDDRINNLLKQESDKQFVEIVIRNYVWSHLNSINTLKNEEKELEYKIALRNRKESDKNTIVYISGNLSSRSEKIINALLRKNYNIIVLEYGHYDKLIINEIRAHNIEYFRCSNVIEVFYSAMTYKPQIYYCEPVWGECGVVENMIRHRNLFGKIVFSPFDILNDGYVRVSEQQKLTERFCLENADGIVWRWFSKEFLEEKKGFIYKGKSIQFLDYCKGFHFDSGNQIDDKLRLCFVQGAIYELLDESKKKNDRKYAEMARIDTILSKLGKRQDCIFHMFVGGCSNSDREKLKLLENTYSNFKVFYGTKYSELIMKISQYDYGCFFYTDGEDVPELESVDDIYYGSNYNNSIQSRYFDYLDARLPIVATKSKKICDYLDELGVLVKMDIFNIDIEYLKKNKMRYKQNVERAREKMLIDNHIQKLIDFLGEL